MHNNEEILSAIENRLKKSDDTSAYCPILIPRTMKLFETKPAITFQTNVPQQHTVMELFTHDRPGLVSVVAQVFLQHGTQLINAKLTTLGDQVEDVFLITTAENLPLNAAECSTLEQELISNLSH